MNNPHHTAIFPDLYDLYGKYNNHNMSDNHERNC